MSVALLKDKTDVYTQNSATGKDVSLSLATLSSSTQLADADSTQLQSSAVSDEANDDVVITDLATLLMDKLFGKVSDYNGLVADSDELACEVMTKLASALSSDYTTTASVDTLTFDNTSVAYDKPVVESTNDHAKVKLSQRDDSSADEINADDSSVESSSLTSNDLSQFGQLMQILAPSQFAMVATQFMSGNNMVGADSDSIIENATSDSVANDFQTMTTSNDITDLEDDLDAQMDDIINEALESISQKIEVSKSEAKSIAQNDMFDASNAATKSVLQKDTSDVNNVLPARVDDIVKNNFVAEQYQNLVDSGYTIPLIQECLILFETKMKKKSDEASKNVKISDVEIDSSIVDEAMSAYASLSGISFPYKTNISNPKYVASNDFANDDIDEDGNPKYIVCNDLASLFNYAYNSANSDNLDIGLLQSKLGGLYDQLRDFDPKFAINISSHGFNSTNGVKSAFDPQEFIKTFTDYVKYVNEYILTAL